MAGKLIARLPVQFQAGEWTVEPAGQWEERRLYERCAALSRDGPVQLVVEICKATDGRTLAQNRMMWRLLQIMAKEADGRAGGTKAEDCYMQMLEAAGAQVDYLCVPLRAIPRLRQAWRVVKIIELLPGNKATVKCVAGSSQYDRAEMRDFIDSIFDRLAEMGVDDAEVSGYYRDWRMARRE